MDRKSLENVVQNFTGRSVEKAAKKWLKNEEESSLEKSAAKEAQVEEAKRLNHKVAFEYNEKRTVNKNALSTFLFS